MMTYSELLKYQFTNTSEKPLTVKIVCIDGATITGEAIEVEDKEESGLEEPGITLYNQHGPVVIGLSEIDRIEVVSDK